MLAFVATVTFENSAVGMGGLYQKNAPEPVPHAPSSCRVRCAPAARVSGSSNPSHWGTLHSALPLHLDKPGADSGFLRLPHAPSPCPVRRAPAARGSGSSNPSHWATLHSALPLHLDKPGADSGFLRLPHAPSPCPVRRAPAARVSGSSNPSHWGTLHSALPLHLDKPGRALRIGDGFLLLATSVQRPQRAPRGAFARSVSWTM